jgi:hypothetical protein
MTEATRAKISAAHMGKHHSVETRAKISAAQKGKRTSPETLARLVASHKGISPTPETRAKISASLLGHVISLKTREKLSAMAINHCTPEWRAMVSARNWKGGHKGSKRKANAKRRVLGFIPLNQPFDGCNGHHIDRERVVYIPEVLHMSIRHNVWNGHNMAKINAVAFNFLFKQEVEAALGGTA